MSNLTWNIVMIFMLFISFIGANIFYPDKVIADDKFEPYWESRTPYQGKIDTDKVRPTYLMNKNWEYLQENISSIHRLKNIELEWQPVDLPHTWNQFDVTDNEPGYRRTKGWYRKQIFIPKTEQQFVFRLYFEGVNISCDVFVNNNKAGTHIGGYVGFTIDITPYIKKGEHNEIAICVDNSINREIIPSQKSDFFIYGGITRNVWLKILHPVFIEKFFIMTPKVSSKEALTSVKMNVMNDEREDREISLEASILDQNDQIVSQENILKTIDPGKNSISIDLPAIKQPALWSPEQPNLYKLFIKLKNGRIVDQVIDKFGYRWYEFKKNGPFYLNGKRLLIRGTCRHEDHAGYGNAIPDSLQRKDMELIKEIGANFVRLAHYPQAPEVYRACDELGLLVWDELPWCRGGIGNENWKENTRRLLAEQIYQNYNHPSIILWSLGNEIYWLPDFPDGRNTNRLRAFLTELNDLAHKLDPHRLTAIRKFYDGADIVDVFSPSIWSGWYSGVYKNYEKALTSSREKYDRFVHMEYGGASHVGRHTENPITGEGLVKESEWEEEPNMVNVKNVASASNWSESYIVDLFDWYLHVSEQLDWFAGHAQWAIKDFPTPLRPENAIPYINQKGLFDRAGKPKDACYVFKSYWTTNPKFCYIESPTWKNRTGAPGEKKQVCVYSNCDKVTLFINGEDQGEKIRDINDFPACGFHWNVIFKKGKNTLKALGFSKGEQVANHQMKISYITQKNDKPQKIALSLNQTNNGYYLIEALALDKNDQLCLDYNERVYFDLNGGGYFKKYYGTPTGSNIIEFANGRAAIEFIPEKGKKTVIEARTQDLKGDYLLIPGDSFIY